MLIYWISIGKAHKQTNAKNVAEMIIEKPTIGKQAIRRTDIELHKDKHPESNEKESAHFLSELGKPIPQGNVKETPSAKIHADNRSKLASLGRVFSKRWTALWNAAFVILGFATRFYKISSGNFVLYAIL